MTTQTILPIDHNSITELSISRDEPAWLAALRLEALELAGQLALPKLEKARIDRWKIDSYGTYKEADSIQSIADLPESIKGLLHLESTGENILVQRNSNVIYSKLSAELAEQGILFMDLESALKQHHDLVRPYFMEAIKKEQNQLTALHAAMWSGGVFLYIPENIKVALPLQALFLSDDEQAAFLPHIIIVAEANSSVTYVDNYVSHEVNGQFVHNGIVEVYVKSGAHVQYASVHNLSETTTDLSYRRAIVDKDAKMDWVIGEMNYGDTMSDTSSVHLGSGSSSVAKVVCVGSNEQKLNITTHAIHIGKNSNSDMITRAVLRDKATAIINGITKIEKGATNTHGEQTEKILMLSPRARGDANPMLLIDEDEVTAGHAASVGQVNEEQVHYLMSRGISREEANRLIVYGFLAPIVSQIPIKNLEEQLQSLVERKLGQ